MKRLAILVEEQYQVLEVWYPYLRFKEAGVTASFIGPEKKEYKSKEGYPVKADFAIREVSAEDFDGVIVPGGWAPDFLRRYPAINTFVKTLAKQGKCVAGICHGGWVLASADVLRGKRATSFMAIKDDVVNAGATYIDEEVVVDGNLITSRTPYDLSAFCRAILGFLKVHTPQKCEK